MNKTLDRFDIEFPAWPEPVPGAGRELGPLAGTGMYMQYEADREHRDKEIAAVRRFIEWTEKLRMNEVLDEVEKAIKSVAEAVKIDPQVILAEVKKIREAHTQ